MANYYGTGRTNYVKVKDEAAFREAVKEFATVVEKDGRFALLDNNGDGGGWDFSIYNEEEEDYDDIDVVELLAPMLEEGEVMVFQEAGAEKYCYVSGWAMAFNAAGVRAEVSLSDIYDLAKKLGPNVTVAVY